MSATKLNFAQKNDGEAWLQQIVEEAANGNQEIDELLAQTLRVAGPPGWNYNPMKEHRGPIGVNHV
jgi:hypothetical protein